MSKGPKLNRPADSYPGHVNRPERWDVAKPTIPKDRPPGDKLAKPSGNANSRPESDKGDW
jgi:hypothetical protein